MTCEAEVQPHHSGQARVRMRWTRGYCISTPRFCCMRSASASSWGSSARRSAVVVRNNSVQRPLDERPPTCDNTRRPNSSCRGMLWLWSDVGLSTGATPSPPPSTSKASLCGVTPDSEWLIPSLKNTYASCSGTLAFCSMPLRRMHKYLREMVLPEAYGLAE